jgi:cysteine synthase
MTILSPADTRHPLPEHFSGVERAFTYDSLFELVGNTPLLRVRELVPDDGPKLYLKLDQFNYGGSSKDRLGLNIVRRAIADGELKPGQRIIDFGAGNTAISYALAGIATGHPVTTVFNETLSPEKAEFLRFLGVDLVPGRVDVPRDHPDNWAAVAERYENEDPSNWWARQESSAYNPQAHIESTGPEVWHQTDGEITHWIAAIATGGTVSGTARYLKERNPDVQVIATRVNDPDKPTNLERFLAREPGWEDLQPDWAPNVDLDVIDRFAFRSKAEVIDFGWHVARTTGLALGISSILSLRVAVDLAAELGPDDVIVSFSADSARDYLTREYNAHWLRQNGFAEIADRYSRAADGDGAGAGA